MKVRGLDSWIKESLPDAVAYASSLLGSRDQGEDVVQDCFCRLLKHADRYDLPRDGRKLLFRAISNACINQRTRRRKLVSLDEQGRYDEQGKRQLADGNCAAPADLAMTAELRAAIVEGLQRLTVPYRSALELVSLGHSPSEVAEILQLQPSRVRVMLFRARKHLSTFLQTRYSGQEKS